MSERPLSHTKTGKLLATAGGLAGGPLGVIASPLVLTLINLITRNNIKCNRFRIWSILGIILAPICWIPIVIILLGTAVILDPDFKGPSEPKH